MKINWTNIATAALATTTLLSINIRTSVAQVDETVKSGTKINDISHKTTLLILSDSSSGSGSLIAKEGNRCVGVTNRHVVVSDSGEVIDMVVRTYDGEIHPISNTNWFSSEDMAIIEFECTQDYEPVTLATYQLSPGQPVYLSGWPPSLDRTTVNRQFTSGSISTILDTPIDGYAIGYTNVTQGGMSGGQVLDEAGRLVGIHGTGALVSSQLPVKSGFNYGIPVTTLLGRASQNGLNYSLDVVYSSPQKPSDGTIVQAEPAPQSDPRDSVDVGNVMDDVDRTLDTIDKGGKVICGILGC